MPTARADGMTLVRQFRDATRKEAGNQRAEALQRIGQLNQFVLLEAWKDQAAAETHAKAAATGQFRDKIKTIQNAPIDERVHFALSVGPLDAKGGGFHPQSRLAGESGVAQSHAHRDAQRTRRESGRHHRAELLPGL